MKSMPGGTVRISDKPEDFRRFGVDAYSIAPSEDGRRSGDGPGRFEWWYFDALLANGGYVAVVFFTKPFAQPGSLLEPVVSISIKRPGKDAKTKKQPFAATAFNASKDTCDVTIGGNTFQGDLHTYRVRAKVEDLEVDATLVREVDPLRLGTGHLLFEGAAAEHVFGWVAPVPKGRAQLRYRVGEEWAEATGSGYHDHNWGDADLSGLVHDWYWARAGVVGFTVIAVQLTPQKAYGATPRTDFVLVAPDGRYLAKGSANAVFIGAGISPDSESGVPVAQRLTYTFTDGATQYVATFVRGDALLRRALDGQFTPHDPEASGVYLRFGSLCMLERVDGNGRTTLGTVGTTFELMWFGSRPEPRLLDLYAATLTAPKDPLASAAGPL